jgi:chromosomal replication initiator protein
VYKEKRMKNINTIWTAVLENLAADLTKISFDQWIKSIEPISMDGNIFVIWVPNDFNLTVLKERYSELIKNAIYLASEKKYDIKFILDNEIDKNSYNKNKNSEKNNARVNKIESSMLNPKYIFEEFVIGNSNRFAHAASLAVAESPARAYNPLFIYGGVGLGKTHLMHAIGHFILNKNPNAKILYVSSEIFTNELINSIRDDKNEEFRNKYRNLDVLLIDDIQFITGKERTQEEFFHTFNSLHQSNKQIIISSDRPPKEIKTLEDRLRSRFEWGLITDIQPPDFETRIAILKKKAQTDSINIPDDVYDFIARKIKSNIRELEGALTRVIAYSSLTNKDINITLCEEALKGIIDSSIPKQITIEYIKEIVSNHYSINVDDFISPKRNRNIAYPRQIAMYLCRELTDSSLPKIGEEFGGRDHTTVLHAYDKVSNDMINDLSFKESVYEIIKKIKNE